MNTIDLDTASGEIQQACEGTLGGGRLPYFFLVGAGVSSPPIKLAGEIQEDCKKIAQTYERMDVPSSNDPIDTYSHWFDKAYPHPIQRQRYLRSLMAGKPISQANFRLAHLLLETRIANLVITTNFDDFLSRALNLFGKQPLVCDHPNTVDRIDPEERDDIQIVHVHGSFWFYDCCNLRNEIASRAAPASQSTLSMPALLENILWRRMPLVIGYSGWEGDVVMAALQRRLRSPLPNRLYWFCYRNDSIDALPDWLKSHENVYFVVPQKVAQESVPESVEAETAGQSRLRSSGQSDVKSKAAKTTEEPTLPAQQVLDKLIQTFALSAPMLTSDPLGYFANYLRSSLPQEEGGRSAADLYFIKSVVERIERAKEREDSDRQALRVIESTLEDIRNALRRSQYREAIIQARGIQLKDMSSTQLRELMEAVWSAATLLDDKSDEEIYGYDLVSNIYDALSNDTRESDLEGAGPSLGGRAATALLYKGITLGSLNRHVEEVATYDEVIRRFGEATESKIRATVGDALINKGLAFGELHRDADELAAYDEVLRRYGELTDPALLEPMMRALFNKGIALGASSRFEEAIEVCDEVVKTFSDSTELSLQEAVAQALVNKGTYLGKLNRSDDEIAAYDEVLNQVGGATESTLREQVANALFNKAGRLAILGRNEEAIAICDDVVMRFGEATELSLRETVAQALINKGVYLGKVERSDEELAAYDEVLNRVGGASESALREQVANALFNKARRLAILGRNEEAIALCDEVVTRFGEATELSMREAVARALVNKGNYLGRLNRNDDEIAAYDEVLKRVGDATEVSLRNLVAVALNGIGFDSLSKAKLALSEEDQQRGRALLLKAQDEFKRAIADKPDGPIIMANQGYAAFLLGEKDVARALLSKSIELGGEEIREVELKDAKIHPLPEDEEFRALLRTFPVGEPKPS